MERLTRKSLEYKDTWIADGSLSNIEGIVSGNAIDRLAELEDVLEKYDIDDAKQLDNIINSIRTNTLIDMEYKEILELENANLKSELAELKQKAIVLPFEFDKPIYKLCPKCNYQHTDCKNCAWRGCGFNQCYDICHEEDRGRIICEIILKKDNCNVSWNAIRFISEHWGEYYFATKEEAEQKLAEIKGEER